MNDTINKIVVIFLCLLTIDSFSQSNTFSPYSRFGLGTFSNNFSSYYQSMGGASTASLNSVYVNPSNPASYSLIQPKKFIFHTSLKNNTTFLESSSKNEVYNNAKLSSLIFGFPINNKIGFSSGFLPYTNSGYDLFERDVEFEADKFYKGTGGISKLYFGTSFKISKSLSVGANASYLFGAINREKRIIFDDESIFHSRSVERVNIKGYDYEIGLLFKNEINQNDFSLAVVLNSQSNISSKRFELAESFEFSGFSEQVKDTFVNLTQRGELTLPQLISFGLSYKLKNLNLIGEYSIQDWSNYQLFGQSDDLISSEKLNIGLEYYNQNTNSTAYLSKVKYRFGFYNFQTPIQLNNNKINETGLTFGIGLPNQRSKTIYDLSLLLGRRGTTNDNLISENFVEIGLSINFDAIWFIKRKYD